MDCLYDSANGGKAGGIVTTGITLHNIERFRQLAENAWDVIYRYRVTPTPGFEYVSPSVTRVIGYTPEELYADPGLTGTHVHPDDRTRLNAMLEQPGTATADPVTIRFTHRDGRTIWTEHRIILVRDTGGGVVAVEGIARDVTDRVVAYQTLERRVEERTEELERRRTVAESLRDVLTILNSSRLLEEILDFVVVQAGHLLGAEGVAVWRLQADGTALSIQSARGLEPDYVAEVIIPVGHGVVGRAVEARRPVAAREVLNTFRDDSVLVSNPRLRALLERNAGHYHALLAVPLIVKDEVYGGLVLYYPQPRQFSAEEVALAVTLGDHAALAIENARLRAQAEETGAAAERSRLARELHDAVTQTLFSASLIADVVPRLWERNPEEGRRRLEELRRLTRGALAEMRTLLLELRPAALIDVPLADLLRQLTDAISGRTLLPIALVVEGQRPLPPDVNIALYRVAQEALNNIVKHATATHVQVTLRHAVEGAELRIVDDGVGFDPDKISAEHFGLKIIRERAESIDAGLNVTSRPGRGTEIACVWLASGEGRA